MKFRVALLLASIVSAPTALLAQPVTGPYVSLGAGLDYVLDQNLRSGSQGYAGVNNLSNNVGGVASGAFGYGLGNGIRIELQGDWGATRVDRGINTTSNYQQQYHGFVNALYDFQGSSFGYPGINPYLGAGVGYGQSHFSNLNLQSTDAIGTPTLLHTTGTYVLWPSRALPALPSTSPPCLAWRSRLNIASP